MLNSQLEQYKSILRVTVLENRWIPDTIREGLTPKQATFLAYDGREALFGGGAGPGKSTALLMAALQYVDESGYSALILRRTFKQLAKADSILAKAKEWLIPLGVKYNGDDHKFTFPSGSTLEFGHMDHEDSKYDYQGGAWSFVGVDECTQFTETMLAYPRTRQRRLADSAVPIRWRGASNPGGVSHDYVKARYVKAKDGSDPQTADRRFFPALIADNPHIDQADYIRQLKESGIDGLLLAQLLRGDWDAVAGGRFKAEWFGEIRRTDSPDFLTLHRDGEEIERFQWQVRPKFQTCDPAAGTTNAADYFVLSTWCLTPKANICWLACERGRWEIQEQLSLCQRSYRRWHPQFVAVEEVLGQRALAQLMRRSTDPAMVVRGVTPGGKKKLEHALGAIVLASTNRIYLPADNPVFPLDDVVSELTRFTGNDEIDGHDDICDSLSIAADMLPFVAGSGARPLIADRFSPQLAPAGPMLPRPAPANRLGGKPFTVQRG